MPKYRSHIVIATVAVLAIGLSACSSSGNRTNSNTATHSGSPAAASSAGNAGSDVAALVQKIESQPTTVPAIGQKIGKPIPDGKTVYTIDCGLPACVAVGTLVAEAAAKLGWTTKDIKTDGTPQQISAAWQQVITDKPDFAVDEGAPVSQIKTYMDKAKANGTVIVANGLADDSDQDLSYSTQNGASTAVYGDAMAAWIASDAMQSGNSTAGAVYVDLPDFSVLKPPGQTFKSSLARYCPGCQESNLDIGLSNLGNSADLIVSYLRSHPSIKYVAFSILNAFDNVPPAIKAAGLKVKIVGTTPSATSLTLLHEGSIDAALAFPYYELSYALVDAMARSAAGVATTQPAPAYASPLWLLTKTNAPSTALFPIVNGAANEYTKVWGKS